ncbi:hypothetical protein HYX05_05350 [Candidatus Woesearchaeota archaeon]|nr:hypothetical protein [Candidatus Woesearchaeota archaeon]
MDTGGYYNKFYDIQLKSIQVLRIKKKLEERREAILLVLHNLDNYGKILTNLNLLEQIYKREERVLTYCEKGLDNAKKILDEVEDMTNDSQGLKTRIQMWLPFTHKGYSIPILQLLRLVFGELRRQIYYILENFNNIKQLIQLQHGYVVKIRNVVVNGDVIGNISETKEFELLEARHNDELEIIKKIEKNPHQRKIEKLIQDIKESWAKMNQIINKNPHTRKLLEKVKPYPKLASIQSILAVSPTGPAGAAVGYYFFGAALSSVFYGLGWVLAFTPSYIALYLEYRKSKIS